MSETKSGGERREKDGVVTLETYINTHSTTIATAGEMEKLSHSLKERWKRCRPFTFWGIGGQNIYATRRDIESRPGQVFVLAFKSREGDLKKVSIPIIKQEIFSIEEFRDAFDEEVQMGKRGSTVAVNWAWIKQLLAKVGFGEAVSYNQESFLFEECKKELENPPIDKQVVVEPAEETAAVEEPEREPIAPAVPVVEEPVPQEEVVDVKSEPVKPELPGKEETPKGDTLEHAPIEINKLVDELMLAWEAVKPVREKGEPDKMWQTREKLWGSGVAYLLGFKDPKAIRDMLVDHKDLHGTIARIRQLNKWKRKDFDDYSVPIYAKLGLYHTHWVDEQKHIQESVMGAELGESRFDNRGTGKAIARWTLSPWPNDPFHCKMELEILPGARIERIVPFLGAPNNLIDLDIEQGVGTHVRRCTQSCILKWVSRMPASDVRLEAILGFRIGIDSHYINSGECEIVQKAFIETE